MPCVCSNIRDRYRRSIPWSSVATEMQRLSCSLGEDKRDGGSSRCLEIVQTAGKFLLHPTAIKDYDVRYVKRCARFLAMSGFPSFNAPSTSAPSSIPILF